MDGWQSTIEPGDWVDLCFAGQWIDAEVIDVSSLHFEIIFKQLGEVCEEKIEKNSPRLAPSKSKVSFSVSDLIIWARCAQQLLICCSFFSVEKTCSLKFVRRFLHSVQYAHQIRMTSISKYVNKFRHHFLLLP
jgi:hypothetical protein